MINYYTSESVSCGHPDKICDQISDAILDEFLKQDKESKVACECFITNNLLVIGGEAHSQATVDIIGTAKRVIEEIGYDGTNGFNPETAVFVNTLHEQSSDIRQGVDKENVEYQGAGDQGIMFGYATNETPDYLPLSVVLSNTTMKVYDRLRKEGKLPGCRPDAKCQYTIEYEENYGNYIPIKIDTMLISMQHDEDVTTETLKRYVNNIILPEVCKEKPYLYQYFYNGDYKQLVNPTGRFVIGGPEGDTGLCLNENTLIYTTKGLMKIKDLSIGQNVYTTKGKAKIINKFFNGEKETKIITDKHNIEIEATNNHPFLVWDGEKSVWKLCSELKVGDLLLKRRFSRYKFRHDELNSHSYKNKTINFYKGHLQNRKSIKINNDFSYLMGWFVGDGNTTSNDRLTFYFNENSEEEKETLYENLLKVFDKEDIKFYESQKDRFSILSSSLYNEIVKLGISPSTARNKEVPKFVLEGNNQIKQSFLKGLFDSDGFVSNNNGRNKNNTHITLTTTSKTLAQQVTNLLYTLSIISSVYCGNSKSHLKHNGTYIKGGTFYHVYIVGEASIKRFSHLIGFSLPSKNNILKKSKEKNMYNDERSYYVVPLLEKLFKYDNDLKIRYGFKKDADKQALKIKRKISNERLSYILDIYGKYCNTNEWIKLNDLITNFDTTQIKTIKDSKSITWDITLDDNTHAFIGNSFIVHNTGRKIIVDTYGGKAPHGGGAFSGKDPSKVDRSAAYYARYIAKNIVHAGLANNITIQLSYGIGISKPISINVEGKINADKNFIIKLINDIFNPTPYNIIKALELKQPKYQKTATYGHFSDENYSWEKCDKYNEIIEYYQKQY